MKNLKFDFMSKQKIAMICSVSLILIGVGSLIVKGLELGIDFTGGTLVEVGYQQEADLTQIRKVLSENGFNDAVVQYFGNNQDVLIRLAPTEGAGKDKISEQVLLALKQQTEDLKLRRVEFVGPQVGDELKNDGGLAILYTLFGILLYVGLRFEYRFAVAAIIALIHDVLITIGIFSLLGMEFNLTILAAILAVIGYSLNDTIVVFDRIRENFRLLRKDTSANIINISLNETLSRTLITSLTTLLVLLSLAIFGGEIIFGFAFALIVGVFVGTYSSIYVASSSVLALGISKEDLMVPIKEGADQGGLEQL